MKAPAILAGKCTSALSRALGRGSGMTFPGVVAEKLHPSLIGDLAATLPEGSVLVSGTNGKSTTSKMLGDVLRATGTRVVRNESGSNLRQGVVSTLVAASNLLGDSLGADAAILEVDEATMPGVAADLSAQLVVVTNLFRDQLDRYGELSATATLIGDAVSSLPRTRLLLNADDPLVVALAARATGPVAFFGVDAPACSRGASGRGQDTGRCPRCGGPLEYHARYYAHLGDWYCPSCGEQRPPLDYAVRDVELHADRSAFTIEAFGQRGHVELPLGGLHNVYNALAAGAAAGLLGVALRDAGAVLGDFTPAFGRTEDLEIAGSRVVLVLAKNPTGAEQAMASVLGDPGPKAVGIALNDNAADGTDISWIWDIDFESYDLSGCTLVLSGSRAEEIALRLKYAGVDARDIRVCRDTVEAVELLASRAGGAAAHLFATYTAMLEIRGRFAPDADRFSGLGRSLRHSA